MARFISVDGKWKPAKERTSLVNTGEEAIEANDEQVQPGEDYIYIGDDRDALKILKESGGELGVDFRHDPDFLQRIRNIGCKEPEEFIRLYQGDINRAKANLEKEEKKVNSHRLPPRKKGINVHTGDESIKGGFGEIPKV